MFNYNAEGSSEGDAQLGLERARRDEPWVSQGSELAGAPSYTRGWNRVPSATPAKAESASGHKESGAGKAKARENTEQPTSSKREAHNAGESKATINTAEEAFEHCLGLARRQIEKAKAEKAGFNESVSGDAFAKKSISSILTDSKQRVLFLSLAEKQENWSRLRPLFGCPPYHFLRPGEASLFRAGGFSTDRTNMSYVSPTKPPNYTQMGVAHFRDDQQREYRVIPKDESDNRVLSDITSLSGVLTLNVRMPRRSIKNRIAIMKTSEKRSVLFPRAGEVLKIQEADQFARLLGKGNDYEKQRARIRVIRLSAPSPNASTAVMAAQVLAV